MVETFEWCLYESIPRHLCMLPISIQMTNPKKALSKDGAFGWHLDMFTHHTSHICISFILYTFWCIILCQLLLLEFVCTFHEVNTFLVMRHGHFPGCGLDFVGTFCRVWHESDSRRKVASLYVFPFWTKPNTFSNISILYPKIYKLIASRRAFWHSV